MGKYSSNLKPGVTAHNPGSDAVVLEGGTSWGEPKGFNPHKVAHGGGDMHPLYFSTKITETMVHDPMSQKRMDVMAHSANGIIIPAIDLSVPSDFAFQPIINEEDETVAVMSVPRSQVVEVDEEGNQLDEEDIFNQLPSTDPKMQVTQKAIKAKAPPPITSRGPKKVGVKQATVVTMPTSTGAIESPSVDARMALAAAKAATHGLTWLGHDKALEPGKAIAWKTPMGVFNTYYHEIVITSRVVILIFDMRFKGTLFLPPAPTHGEVMDMQLSYNSRTFDVMHGGYIFETGELTSLMLLRSLEEVTQETVAAVDPFQARANAQEAFANLPPDDEFQE